MNSRGGTFNQSDDDYLNDILSFVTNIALVFEYGLSFEYNVDKNGECKASCVSEELITSWETLS